MSELLFFLLYIATLTLPGMVFIGFYKARFDPFLISVSASYAFFSLAFICANHYSLSAGRFTAAIAGVLLLAIACLAWRLLSHGDAWSRTDRQVLLPILVIGVLSGIYQLLFGSFIEVPADLFAHLERFQSSLKQIKEDSLGPAFSWQALFSQKSGVFYYLLAMTADASNASAETVITVVDYCNRTLLLVAVFFFARRVFNKHPQATFIASLTTVFLATHMGINVFAYIRYYTLAPAMVNMVIYLAAISIFLRIITSPLDRNTLTQYVFILLLIAAAATIHVQEALFIVVMISTISVIAMLNQLPRMGFLEIKISASHVRWVAALAVSAFFLVYAYSYLNLDRAPNAHWRLWEFSSSKGFLPAITTLNLKFQFSRVITLWGMLVYLLFFLHIRRYTSNLFIVAGMLSPVFTILNPFFVDVFLRHYNSTTLWRLCFLIPIHFVAADLMIHYLQRFRQHGIAYKISSVLVLSPLVLLLLPIKNTWNGIHYSRFPTLQATDPQLSYEYSSDLLAFLNSLDKPHRILTDPMTGYMVSAMTRHTHLRKKFMRDPSYERFTFESYTDRPLKKYQGYLLIINRRPQKSSAIGALAKHWSHREWQNTVYYYPPPLLDRLATHSQYYEKLWEADGITVYRIK